MRLACFLRHRRRLMQFEAPRPTSSSSPSQTHLKRSFAQQATAQRTEDRRSPQESWYTYSSRDNHRPGKVPKIQRAQSPSHPTASSTPSTFPPSFEMPFSSPRSQALRGGSRSLRTGTSSAPGSRSSSRSKGKKPTKTLLSKIFFSGPLHDQDYIIQNYKKTIPGLPTLKDTHEDNPKSPVSNFVSQISNRSPEFSVEQGFIGVGKERKEVYRTIVAVPNTDIVGIGDHASKKESEKLAALSAVYQLHAQGLLYDKKISASSSADHKDPTVVLSDGSEVTYERARQFMDYYCNRYKFGKPDIALTEISKRGGSNWEAVMTVGGRRIGLGSSHSKKTAQKACYLDVTQYLESCDADLWKTFLEAAKTGKDLGLAPKILFTMGDKLEDEVRDLCHDIKKSLLYKNRPAIGSGKTGSDAADSNEPGCEVPAVVPSRRRPLNPSSLKLKSEKLLKRYQEYLAEPNLLKMRSTRASLPVYTRAEELIAHIRDKDVTILMAATGSGKTTQVPQLILDDYIARGEGAKCNIFCTQPRRIAALSVADRVAKERGETVGQGTVGYQVRFETKLPQEHGSITFCTTGVFLKRMQTALSGGGHMGRTLDDVTHVVVDEVHERDVDTDLLLVVLKRLLANRKAGGNPLKVILMSATIDPTLFQNYFPDDEGQPASATVVPGRSFPVKKHFLEDYLPQLAKSPHNRWVFAQESVEKYLRNELDASQLSAIGLATGFHAGPTKDGDLDLPYPLIALTVAHVLRQSDSGHVLVFLPGWDEIMNVQRCLLDASNPFGQIFSDASRYSIHLLHSTVPLAEQQLIFEPPPDGVRRIILATNIAETSVTIPDVVYVVDTAKIKEMRYDPERHMSSLVSAWIGSSNLNQRAGRAGRHRPGEYFGILGQRRSDALHPYQTVEMKRVDLSNVVMHVKALDFPGMAVEDVLAATIEPPAEERVAAATKDLQMVGALDQHKNLTSLGRVLLQLPVEAQMGRLVLFGSFFRCLDQALTLAAILTNRDPFLSPMHLKTEAASKKNSFAQQEFRSDALATLRAYNLWSNMQERGEYIAANRFCIDNFLSKPTLLMIQKIRKHLLQSLYHAGIIAVSAGGSVTTSGTSRDLQTPPELNTNGDSLPLLGALVAIASQPKFAIRTGEKTYRTSQDKMTFIHPSSVNHTKREVNDSPENTAPEKQLYAFSEKRQNVAMGGSSAQMFLVTTTRLDPLSYMLFGAYNIEVTERGLECDGWLPIVGNIDALDDIQRLKTLMESCMLRVFEGITISQNHRLNVPNTSRREESEFEDDFDSMKDLTMSQTEIKELDLLTRDIVRILNHYNEERLSTLSRQNSRPSTPMGGPISLRSPGSGFSTPCNHGSPFNSRPNTPSRLWRRS